MNDLTGKYFVKKTKDGEYQDFATLFDGLRILKIDGFMSEGQPKNVYTASWEYDDDEDFAIVMQDDEDTIRIIRECSDLEITFIIKGSYATNTIDVNTQHLRFKNYMLGKDVWIKSVYQDELEVHCVCLKEYKPTTEKYHRGTDSYVLGTITMHMLEKPTNTKMRPIVFQDPVVKQLCVENWGGTFYDDEITEWEASHVTSLNGVFRSNTTITKFNEFRYFTGITTFTHPSNNPEQGEFYGCTKLEEITFPSINIQQGDFRGLLRNCNKLKSVDLSPIVANSYHINYMMYLSTTSSAVEKVTLPSGYYGGGSGSLPYARYALRNCANMTTLEIKGTADWSGISNYQEANVATGMFYRCDSLTNIIGTITGIKNNLYIGQSPNLTHDSLLVIIDGLADLTGKTGKTLELHATAKALLTADDIAIATAKNWTIS
jgi:hypothetical protein